MIKRLSIHFTRPSFSRCRCNPLETLRTERDPAQRAKLLTSLDGKWSDYTEIYKPSAIEDLLSKELGVDPHAIMTLAVGSGSKSIPPLCLYDISAAMSSIKKKKLEVRKSLPRKTASRAD